MLVYDLVQKLMMFDPHSEVAIINQYGEFDIAGDPIEISASPGEACTLHGDLNVEKFVLISSRQEIMDEWV